MTLAWIGWLTWGGFGSRCSLPVLFINTTPLLTAYRVRDQLSDGFYSLLPRLFRDYMPASPLLRFIISVVIARHI